jgi:glycosyltransferase involved in cell wall biosynthesis
LTRLLLSWWRLRWRPDLLHVQGYTEHLLFVIDWAHARGLPVVYEEHQTPDDQFGWWTQFSESVNKAAVVVGVSEKSARALKSVCGITRPVIVRSPLLPDPLPDGLNRSVDDQRTTDKVFLTSVARLYVTKGLTYLLDAFRQVRETHPKVCLKVFGDGPLREELMSYAERIGLNGHKIFPGAFTSREELARIMEVTDIFVMSSILEGQPLSLVEAMAYGCPIVTTTVGGIPELIEDGVNGLLCPPRDSECLVQKIRLLLEDSILRERLSRAARASYEEGPYQSDSVATYFVSLYQAVLENSGDSLDLRRLNVVE